MFCVYSRVFIDHVFIKYLNLEIIDIVREKRALVVLIRLFQVDYVSVLSHELLKTRAYIDRQYTGVLDVLIYGNEELEVSRIKG